MSLWRYIAQRMTVSMPTLDTSLCNPQIIALSLAVTQTHCKTIVRYLSIKNNGKEMLVTDFDASIKSIHIHIGRYAIKRATVFVCLPIDTADDPL